MKDEPPEQDRFILHPSSLILPDWWCSIDEIDFVHQPAVRHG